MGNDGRSVWTVGIKELLWDSPDQSSRKGEIKRESGEAGRLSPRTVGTLLSHRNHAWDEVSSLIAPAVPLRSKPPHGPAPSPHPNLVLLIFFLSGQLARVATLLSGVAGSRLPMLLLKYSLL